MMRPEKTHLKKWLKPNDKLYMTKKPPTKFKMCIEMEYSGIIKKVKKIKGSFTCQIYKVMISL